MARPLDELVAALTGRLAVEDSLEDKLDDRVRGLVDRDAGMLEPSTRELVIAREISKKFEEIARMTLADAPAWLASLPAERRILLDNALATLYKRIGVDLIEPRRSPTSPIRSVRHWR